MVLVASHVQSDSHLWRSFAYHSRTFSLAARLLPPSVQLPIATLYLFCRTVDTIADEQVLECGPQAALQAVRSVRADLDATLAGAPPDTFFWRRLHRVHERFGLAPGPLYELIDGAIWDLEGRPIQSPEDLVAYAGLVGGSVGAMMLPFLLEGEPASPSVEAAARSLGIAMQLTNILRDVGEDYRRLGRVYLPHAWMAQHGLLSDVLAADRPPAAYARFLETVMDLADAYYEQGFAGIEVLPWRVRPGIRAAARMYREIMNEVRAQGYDNYRHRAFVPAVRKLRLVVGDGYHRRKYRLRGQRLGVPA